MDRGCSLVHGRCDKHLSQTIAAKNQHDVDKIVVKKLIEGSKMVVTQQRLQYRR